MKLVIKVKDLSFSFFEQSEFEKAYFGLLRLRLPSVGYKSTLSKGKTNIIFQINEEGREIARPEHFVVIPSQWVPPTKAMTFGLFSQFKNISKISQLLQISEASINGWKSLNFDKERRITFFKWFYILSLLDIQQDNLTTEMFPIKENLFAKTIKKELKRVGR